MSGTELDPDTAKVAIRLSVAISRLRSRLRVEAGITKTALSITQLSVLQRLLDGGPTTAASLSALEHVSQQAISQSLATLKKAGLVESTTDPTDGRKNLIHVTAAGRDLLDKLTRSREAWLMKAIDAIIEKEERSSVDTMIEFLERLAEADLSPDVDIR